MKIMKLVIRMEQGAGAEPCGVEIWTGTFNPNIVYSR